MSTIDHLTEDHRLLRHTLDALDEALIHGTPTWAFLRESCRALSTALQDHTRREVRLAVSCSRKLGTVGAAEMARFAVEHHIDQQYLKVLVRCLQHESRFSLDAIRPMLMSFINGLRRRMPQQEAELFPLLECVFGAPADVRRRGEPAPVSVLELVTMHGSLNGEIT